MTRLRTLIKEVLSQPKKKDCGCGCNDCGGKAPILTEGKVKHLISEGLQYHIDKKIQLHESVYRIGSEKHFELIREARALWVRGIINVSEDDQAILETNLGNFGMYEGEAVPLDMPMVNEGGADTAWEDEKGNKVTLQDILDMTKNVPQKDYSTEKLAKVVLNWDDNPEEVERIEQVEVSKQYPILIMVDEAGKIQWILDGNHRAQKALRSKAKTIPAKLIKPSMLNAKAKKVLLGVVDESLNEDEAAFEYNKARAGRIMKDLFGSDFEFDYTYKLEGDRIIIHPEGYNPDGTLFDMKDVHKEKIIRTFRDKMPRAQAQPNMGGGITVNLNRSSLNEAKKKKKKDPPIGKPKRGGPKAYYVYVRDPKTKKIKKVTFGSGGLKAKIRNKKARNAFAARHRCKTANDRTTARYWSCRLPRYAKQLGLGSNMNTFW